MNDPRKMCKKYNTSIIIVTKKVKLASHKVIHKLYNKKLNGTGFLFIQHYTHLQLLNEQLYEHDTVLEKLEKTLC